MVTRAVFALVIACFASMASAKVVCSDLQRAALAFGSCSIASVAYAGCFAHSNPVVPFNFSDFVSGAGQNIFLRAPNAGAMVTVGVACPTGTVAVFMTKDEYQMLIDGAASVATIAAFSNQFVVFATMASLMFGLFFGWFIGGRGEGRAG